MSGPELHSVIGASQPLCKESKLSHSSTHTTLKYKSWELLRWLVTRPQSGISGNSTLCQALSVTPNPHVDTTSSGVIILQSMTSMLQEWLYHSAYCSGLSGCNWTLFTYESGIRYDMLYIVEKTILADLLSVRSQPCHSQLWSFHCGSKWCVPAVIFASTTSR